MTRNRVSGSEYYAAEAMNIAQTVGGVNMDALNPNGPQGDIVVVGRSRSQLDAYLEKIAKAAKVTIVDEPTPKRASTIPSDRWLR